MTTEVAQALDDKDSFAVQALYLDFSKAFDLMRPDILAKKLIAAGINSSTIRVILNFLTDRSQCVSYMGNKSESQSVKIGVPQGTISGPVLWNIYVADLIPTNNTLKYADDTTLYSTVSRNDINITEKAGRTRRIDIDPNPMQLAADKATEWCNTNQQIINATKTQHMFFTLQLEPTLCNPISIKGENITQTTSAKLLGVHLDSHLTFNEHVHKTINKTKTSVHGLLTLKRHGVRDKLLVKYYQSCIIPIISYAAPSWYTHITEHSKNRLEKHQSLCLRIIYPGIESYTERLKLANILRLNDYLLNVCREYSINVHTNPCHRLASLLPPRQSTRRHCPRLRDSVIASRTSLLRRSLFHCIEFQ